MTTDDYSQSRHELWAQYRKDNAPYVTYIGEGNRTCLVLDENFKVLYKGVSFDDAGEMHPDTQAAFDKYGVKKQSQFGSVEEVIRASLCDWRVDHYLDEKTTEHMLSRIAKTNTPETDAEYKKHRDELVRLDETRPQCAEYSTLDQISSYIIRLKGAEGNSFVRKQMEENGALTEALEWAKQNTSLTPLQDTLKPVLELEGIVVDWEPCELGVEPIKIPDMDN